MRTRVQGVSVELGSVWEVQPVPPWWDVEDHGLYVIHRSTRLALHVRAWSRAGDGAALLDELRAQQWGQPPFEIDLRYAGVLTIVAASFRYSAAHRVREWFVSDGRRSANMALLHPNDVLRGVLVDSEALAESIEFG